MVMYTEDKEKKTMRGTTRIDERKGIKKGKAQKK